MIEVILLKYCLLYLPIPAVVHKSCCEWSMDGPGVLLEQDEHPLPHRVYSAPHQHPTHHHPLHAPGLPGQDIPHSVNQGHKRLR